MRFLLGLAVVVIIVLLVLSAPWTAEPVADANVDFTPNGIPGGRLGDLLGISEVIDTVVNHVNGLGE